jgi:hypothetical protein
MAELQDGESVVVAGSTSTYTLERKGDVYSCTCPAWRNQKAPIADRVCKHLLGYLDGDIGAISAPQRAGARPAWVPEHTDSPEVNERRRSAIAEALECFPVAFDKMMSIYNLRLPKHVAYAIGFWNGLSHEEREGASHFLAGGPDGVGSLFVVGGLDRTAFLDERLEARYRLEPPEFVPVFRGFDGNHFGLWYDDPADLPRMIASFYARERDALIYAEQPTLLGSLRKRIYDSPHGHPEITEHTGAVLAWLEEVYAEELAAHREEKIGPFQRRADSTGGIGPWIPDWRAPTRRDFPQAPGRAHAYQEHAPEVDNWIARARKDLDDGKPGLALLVGHDLHHADRDAYRGVCTELLLGSYKALGRNQMFELVRLHHRYRDLKSATVYDQQPVDPADGIDWHLLEIKYGPEHERAAHAQAIDALMERGIDGNTLDLIVRLGDADLVTKAFAHVDLSWRDDKGRSVLHHMVLRCNVEAVRLLLERGADGEGPYEAVANVWTDHRADADQMYALLRAKGFGPKPKAKPLAPVSIDFKEGDRVAHVQYGEGVVKVSFGGKLTILFEKPPGEKSGMKTIAAKFVTKL